MEADGVTSEREPASDRLASVQAAAMLAEEATMGSAARFLALAAAAFVGFMLTGGGLAPWPFPGPPVVWFIVELILFALAGLFLAIAGIRAVDALGEKQAREP